MKNVDMVNGNITKGILSMTIPLMAQSVLQTLFGGILYQVIHNERAVWENIFDVFPSQNPVLARNLHGKFPALHCNVVFGNYFPK